MVDLTRQTQGLFTVLTAVAAYVLLCVLLTPPNGREVPLLTCYSSKGIKRTATAIMLMAIILMWMSTAADWIGTLMWAMEAYTVTSTFTFSLSDRT